VETVTNGIRIQLLRIQVNKFISYLDVLTFKSLAPY
jgi:hypothetical protein